MVVVMVMTVVLVVSLVELLTNVGAIVTERCGLLFKLDDNDWDTWLLTGTVAASVHGFLVAELLRSLFALLTSWVPVLLLLL
jgi:hypothetical protein